MGTKYKGTAGQIRALDSFIKLVRSAESVTREADSWFSGEGLTVSQFGVLEALVHLGPMSHKDLARKILKSGGNITMVVTNLERAGLVERREDCKDRRRSLVDLTAEGVELIERLFSVHVDRVVERMSVLTPDEQVELARLCRKLGRNQ